ncbi:MAG: protein kinase [archaeon]|nr:protein kinase [archaeon]
MQSIDLEHSLNTKYKIVRHLSKNQTETQYLIQNKETKKYYLRQDVIFHNSFSKAYKEEIQKTLKSSHPNIVSRDIYPIKNNTLCIITEKFDLNLESIIKSRKTQYFSEATISDWFTQICLGIKSLHENNIIHRDLHPKNIFFDKDNKMVKIGEFSCMKILRNENQKAITFIGEDFFMAPEILISLPYSFASDVWSLGIILFYLITLKLPFDFKELLLIKSVKKVDKNKLGLKLNQKYFSKEIKELVLWLLEGDPIKRPNINQILLHEPIKKTLLKFQRERKYPSEFFINLFNDLNLSNKKDSKSPKRFVNIKPIEIQRKIKSTSRNKKKINFNVLRSEDLRNIDEGTKTPNINIININKEQTLKMSDIITNGNGNFRKGSSDIDLFTSRELSNTQREDLVKSLEMDLGEINANNFYSAIKKIFPNKESFHTYINGDLEGELNNILKTDYMLSEEECNKCLSRLTDMIKLLSNEYEII